MKKVFNGVMCWVCVKLFDAGHDKVRDIVILQKNRGSAHWNCNVNLKLTKNVRVIFHNLRSYNSHLIIQEVSV